MSYRNILVCMDEGQRSKDRLHFALRLAAAYDSIVTGLYVSYAPFDADNATTNYVSLITRFQEDQAHKEARVQQEFLGECTDRGIRNEWVSARSLDLKDAIAYTRTADLIIAGQRLSKDAASYIGDNFPDRLVLESGRPVLVIPDSGTLPAAFKQLAIAWNGSREAARAVADALPFLKRAEVVMAFEVIPAPDRNPHQSSVPRPDLRAFLRGHNVNVEIIECTGAMDTGEWILARANGINMQADLMISGAYGHSRVTELILGGVTRTLLQNMNIPVLLSH